MPMTAEFSRCGSLPGSTRPRSPATRDCPRRASGAGWLVLSIDCGRRSTVSDRTSFETRLASALDRYADLAPAIDEEAVARAAIATGRPRLIARAVAALRVAIPGASASPAQDRSSLAVLLIVLLAALIAAAVV